MSPALRRGLLVAFGVLVLAFGVVSALQTVDFPIYHEAGQRALAGDLELYPGELYEGRPAPGHGYRYAPATAFLFAPFALLPLAPAAFIFFLLKAAAFAWMLHLIARRSQVEKHLATLALAALLCTGGYLVEEFRNGNLHLITVAATLLALDRADRGDAWLPGIVLAMVIATKLAPVVILLYWMFKGRFAAAGATAAALVATLVLPIPMVGVNTTIRLTRGFVRYAMEKLGENDNFALVGVLERAHLGSSMVVLIWVVAVLVAGGVLVRAISRPAGEPAVLPIEWSLLLVTILIASPHSQRPYFSVLSVPAAVLAALLLRTPAGGRRALALAALVVCALTGTILPLVLPGRQLALAYASLSPYFVGAVVMWVTLIALRVRRTTIELPRTSAA